MKEEDEEESKKAKEEINKYFLCKLHIFAFKELLI
jgi:hypothetical protein